jgi:hypothetical protein
MEISEPKPREGDNKLVAIPYGLRSSGKEEE